MSTNYRLVAVQVGDLIKWDSSLNEIGRAAAATLPCAKQSFPNESITSRRAQLVHDWILSLARHKMDATARDQALVAFCRAITPSEHSAALEEILKSGDVGPTEIDAQRRAAFEERGFHREISLHCKRLFLQDNFFHSVFEGAKVYNKLVREKAAVSKDGRALMLAVWGWENGVLKITPCQTETDKNVQDGVMFLSAGLMQAIRNPTAHEPAVDWPISQGDCLDILSFLSFLFRKLDEAVRIV